MSYIGIAGLVEAVAQQVVMLRMARLACALIVVSRRVARGAGHIVHARVRE